MPAREKTGSTPVSAKRDPRERFVTLANKRVTAAIQQLRLVGNLANRRNYEYEVDDARKIVRALQRELDDVKTRFKGEESDDSSIFSL
jgi:ABC-type Fe3+-hydroxamate transport system substrate-binding protein